MKVKGRGLDDVAMNEIKIARLQADDADGEQVLPVLASACVSHTPSALATSGSSVIANLAVAFSSIESGWRRQGSKNALGVSREALGAHLAKAASQLTRDKFQASDAAPLIRSICKLMQNSRESMAAQREVEAAAVHVLGLAAGHKTLTPRLFADVIYCRLEMTSGLEAPGRGGASATLGLAPLAASPPAFDDKTNADDLAYAISAIASVHDAIQDPVLLNVEGAYRSYTEALVALLRRAQLKPLSRAVRAGGTLGIVSPSLIRSAERLTDSELRSSGGTRLLVDLALGLQALGKGATLRARAAEAFIDAPIAAYTPRLIADAARAFEPRIGMVNHLARVILSIKEWTVPGAATVLLALNRIAQDVSPETEAGINAAFAHIGSVILSMPPAQFSPKWAALLCKIFSQRPAVAGGLEVMVFLGESYAGHGSSLDDARMVTALAKWRVHKSKAWSVIEQGAARYRGSGDDVSHAHVAALVVAFSGSGRLAESSNIVRIGTEALRGLKGSKEARRWAEVGAMIEALAGSGVVEKDVLKVVAAELASELSLEASIMQEDSWNGEDSLFSPRDLVSLLKGLSAAKFLDVELFTAIGRRAVDYSTSGVFTADQLASIVSCFASSNIVWVKPSETEEIFRNLSPALLNLPRSALKPQVAAVVAGAYSKVRIFDEELFVRISESVRWRHHKSSELSIQAIGILLYAFSRVEVDDRQLLDFLAAEIQNIPSDQFTPQAISIVVTVYAGAHKRKNFFPTGSVAVSELPPATGILDYISRVVQLMGPTRFDTRHVKVIVEAYHRAGVRPEGLYEVPPLDTPLLSPRQ